jgi:soluble lytic murein transglycosylase-like protein
MNSKTKILLVAGATVLLASSVSANYYAYRSCQQLRLDHQAQELEIDTQSKSIDRLNSQVDEVSHTMIEMQKNLDKLEKREETQVKYVKKVTNLPSSAVNEIVYQGNNRKHVDIPLLLAIAKVESNFDPTAVNQSSGATGLTQFLPSSARYVAKSNNLPYDYDRLKDPAYSILLSAAYLDDLGSRYGIYKGLSHYGGDSTDEYASKVWGYRQYYKSQLDAYIQAETI